MQRTRSFGPLAGHAAPLICAIIVAGITTGCSDHRMGLDEFMRMQQDAREAASHAPSDDELAVIQELLDQRLSAYRVGSDDVLTVTVTAMDDTTLFPPVKARINRLGEVELPLVGAVKIGDLDLIDVDATIRRAYVPQYYRSAVVHVEVTAPDYTQVYVHGATTFPGLVTLRRTERNLLFAIVAAGGSTNQASGKVTLRRIRRPTQEVELDLTDPKQLRAALALKPLEDGDIVTVHAAPPNTIFVGGLVNAPRPQTYSPGVEMTLLQVIAAAGGLRTDVTPTEATLIRRMPDGRDAHVKLDLKRLRDGRDPNFALAAGDILWVPSTLGTIVEDFINKNIFMRAGITVTYNVTGTEFLNRRSLQSSRSGGGGGGLQDAFDPLGFLGQNAALQTLLTQPVP